MSNNINSAKKGKRSKLTKKLEHKMIENLKFKRRREVEQQQASSYLADRRKEQT